MSKRIKNKNKTINWHLPLVGYTQTSHSSMARCGVYRRVLLLLVFLSATSARFRDIVPPSAFRLVYRNVPPSPEKTCHLANTVQSRGGGKAETAKSNPWLSFVRIIRDSRRDLAAAAAARCSSILSMYPVDTLKV